MLVLSGRNVPKHQGLSWIGSTTATGSTKASVCSKLGGVRLWTSSVLVRGDPWSYRGKSAPFVGDDGPLLSSFADSDACGAPDARNRYTKTIAGNLLKLWPALWTFTEVEGVEPTNNHAERGLRGAVIYRKLSLGSQSNQGEHTIERLLSASITCRLQKRSLFAYLTELLANKTRGDPAPALI